MRGRHERQPALCSVTWGQCDIRSDQPPDYAKLPHVCGEGMAGHEGQHQCVAPGCTAHTG